MAECRDVARILGWIADFVYHTVSGCATAQTAFELNYQKVPHRNAPLFFFSRSRSL